MPHPDFLSLTLLATSDIHSCIYPTNYRGGAERNEGLAKLAPLIHRERLLDPDLLLIDNGDLIQGTPLASYYAKHNRQQTHPAIRVLNHLQYDAAVIGNHEFNYGRDMLDQIVQDSNFPWLAANIVDEVSGKPVFGPPYSLHHIHGITVAIIGITTPFIAHWEQPEHIQGLQFESSLETLRRVVNAVRSNEQPDVIVAAYHGGFERDLDSGNSLEEDTGENQGYAILEAIPDIDVLITGHQHRLLAGIWKDTAIVQPGCFGEAIGKIRLGLRRSGNRWMVEEKHAELLTVDGDADPQVLILCSEDEARTQAWLDRPVGRTIGDMRIRHPLQTRIREHPFIELVNRIQMEAAGVDVSCTALLHNEAPGFSACITMREVLANYPYANTLKVLRLTGQDIREALEQSAAYFTLDKAGRPAVHPSFLAPKPQHYNYDMWEGIAYEVDLRQPIGRRIVKLHKNGLPLLHNDVCDVVMNHYRASGGGGFTLFRSKQVVREIQIDMVELIEAYLSKHPVITASCNHNWRVLAPGS